MSRKVLGAALAAFALLGGAAEPERAILTGVPPLGPSWIPRPGGGLDPAGCGPEAARLLLLYYDRRFGYRLVDDLQGAIAELHRRMGTVTITWEGVPQGLTWPWAFAPGLAGYIAARYPGGATVRSLGGSLEGVFAQAVELLLRGVPSVILFDWEGEGGIFPNHYALVVGYDRAAGRKQLVLNPGWGYDFQLLDMTDPSVAPATLYWIEGIRDPPDGRPGRPSPRPAAAGMWEEDEGNRRFRPVLRLHFDPGSTVRWPPATRLLPLIPGADDLLLALWDAP